MSNNNVTRLVNPFVGLRSFEESEDYLFFGRGKQIDDLLKKLSDSRFLAVIGSSGSGKSSLVKSGLLPSVYSGFMTVGSNWRVALMQPGEDPIGYLTKELAAENTLFRNVTDNDIPLESIIEASLRRSENGLIQVYKDAHLQANENLLIVVDQFEELFRFSKYEKENKLGKSDAMHFVQILLTAAKQKEYPVYVLLTMRADFLGDCAEFRGLPEAINEGQYLVPRMTRDEIREAITGPVAVSGATISQRLVTRLLNDINNDTDQLPILQHAMMRTWEAWYKRNQHETPIDFEDYEKIGTMKASLSQHADEAYTELTTENQQKVCELMFKALTDKAADTRGVRRPRSIVDLCLLTGATQNEVMKQVEIFRKPGRTFLMPPSHIALNDNSIIDISHESLMRVWERLVKWTEEEARSGDLYVRLSNSAILKEQGQRGLLKDPELEITLRWKEKNKPSAKWAEGYKGNYEQAMNYLEDSRKEDIAEKKILADKEASRKRLIKVIFGLLGLLLIAALIIASWFKIQQQEAKAREQEAIILKLRADSIARVAQLARDTAFIEKNRADINAAAAISAKDAALIAQHSADSNAHVAIIEKARAEDSAAAAREQRTAANRNATDAKNKNLKIAANEYARLIREGPTDKNKIRNDAFNFKLRAYCDHLDSLGPLIKKVNDGGDAFAAYQSLKEKLYFNNDLYEKLYACFENTKTVFTQDNEQVSFPNELDTTDNDFRQVAKQSGKKINLFVEDKKDNRIICATTDNWVYVYKKDKVPFELENKIPMGARVTALDYNSKKSIIYFGIESGDIGYIKYVKDRRNQPVFENTLGTPVTAIQFFTYNIAGEEEPFLLVAGKKSKVVVYKLDDDRPDKKLIGNILPEENLGEVISATFDKKFKVRIKARALRSQKAIIYSWNPFTAEVLEKYRNGKKESDYEEKYLHPTKLY